MQYHIVINGQQIGPMTASQMMAYPVNANTPVSADGGPWRNLFTYPELMELLSRRPPEYMPVSDSRRIVCGLMAILIGWAGLQYFLIGKSTAGIINIVISLVTCGLWTIVTFIQGIMMLLMSDSEFQAKYVNSISTFPVF